MRRSTYAKSDEGFKLNYTTLFLRFFGVFILKIEPIQQSKNTQNDRSQIGKIGNWNQKGIKSPCQEFAKGVNYFLQIHFPEFWSKLLREVIIANLTVSSV